MATAIQRRRGSFQHSILLGWQVRSRSIQRTIQSVPYGSTAGGHRLAKYPEITALGEGDITACCRSRFNW